MRVDLRNLVRSQDGYFGLQGEYSRRTEPFALQYLWHRGVKITILSANDDAWSARATYASRPGKSCVIWLGPVPQRPVTEAEAHAGSAGHARVRRLRGPRLLEAASASRCRGAAVAHRRHLRQNRQRRLGGLAPAQLQPDRPVHPGDVHVAESLAPQPSRRDACVLREPIAPM